MQHIVSQVLCPFRRGMNRWNEHCSEEIRFHQAHAITKQFVIAIAPSIHNKEQRNQQCIQNNYSVMNIRLTEGNGNGYASYPYCPISSNVEARAPDIGTRDFCPELMRHR